MGKKYDIEIAGDRNLSDFDRALIEAHEKGETILSLHTEFESFDPIDNDIPYEDLKNVGRRARDLLQNRSREEIEFAVMFAEDQTSRPLIDLRDPPEHLTNEQLNEYFGLSDEFRPRALYRRRDLIDIKNIDGLAMIGWYEIFAALALAYVARSINRDSGSSMEAMESLGYAESLAAIARANRASKSIGMKWKAMLADFIVDRSERSAPHIAKSFLDRFCAEMKMDRPNAYSKLTITRWVRELRKLSK